MSITVRLWSEQELMNARTGGDLQLSTLLMNATTFSPEMMNAYVHLLDSKKIKQYIAEWHEESDGPVKFQAANDEMALWFLSQEYTQMPDSLVELVTTYREVDPVIREIPLPATKEAADVLDIIVNGVSVETQAERFLPALQHYANHALYGTGTSFGDSGEHLQARTPKVAAFLRLVADELDKGTIPTSGDMERLLEESNA